MRPAGPTRHHLTALDRKALRALWEHLSGIDGQDPSCATPRRSYALTDRNPALGTATLAIRWRETTDTGEPVDRMARIPVVGKPAQPPPTHDPPIPPPYRLSAYLLGYGPTPRGLYAALEARGLSGRKGIQALIEEGEARR